MKTLLTIDDALSYIRKKKRRGDYVFSYTDDRLLIALHCMDGSVLAWDCKVLDHREDYTK